MAAIKKPAAKKPRSKAVKPKKTEGGQPGNKNAERWTEETVMAKIAMMEAYTSENRPYLLAEVCLECDLLPQNFSEWGIKFKDVKVVSESLTRIKARVGLNLNKKGLNNELNAKLVELNLKNNYGWSDKKEVKSETKTEHSGSIKIPGFGWANK